MKKIINIEGMHCDNCKKRIETVLSNIKGVDKVKASLEDSNVIIEYKNVDWNLIEKTIEDLGFKIV